MIARWSNHHGATDRSGYWCLAYMLAEAWPKQINGPGTARILEVRDPVPELLRGDPDLTEAMIGGMPERIGRRYCSGVLVFTDTDVSLADWNAGDLALRGRMDALMKEFEDKVLFPGIDAADRPAICWSSHRHANKLELNFLVAGGIAVGEKVLAINPDPPGFWRGGQFNRPLSDAFQDAVNGKLGFADPNCPTRARDIKVPDHILKIEALKKRIGETSQEDIRQTVTKTLSAQIEAGAIRNRDGVIAALRGMGAEITRATGENYLSVKFPGSEKATRLKGPIYSASFTSPEAIGSPERRVIDVPVAEEKLDRLSRKRGLDQFARYQSKINAGRKSSFDPAANFILTDAQVRSPDLTAGPGGLAADGASTERRRAWAKQKAFTSLYDGALDSDLLAQVKYINLSRCEIGLLDGTTIRDFGDRIEATPAASETALAIMIREAELRGWKSVNVTSQDMKFKIAAAVALTEAGFVCKNPELQHIVNSVRRAKSTAERAPAIANPPPPPQQHPISQKSEKSVIQETKPMDTDISLAPKPRPKAPPPLELANFIRATKQGPRPLPAQPINFDQSNPMERILCLHFGQPWPPERLANVKFVRHLSQHDRGVDITLRAGQVIADRDAEISLAKGQIDLATAEAIVFAAAQKGWQAIQIAEGADPEFRRLIVEAAARQGIEIAGATAEQAREAELERRRQAGAAVAAALLDALPTPLYQPPPPVPAVDRDAQAEAERRRASSFDLGI